MKSNKSSKFDESQTNSIRKKLVVVGDCKCGKTGLLSVFSKGKLPEVYIHRIFENHTPDIEVDGKLVKLYLYDTASYEDSERLRPLSYPDTDVFLICFSISDPVSLSSISEKWLPEVKHFCPNVPILLIGTKKDLRHDGSITNQKVLHEEDKESTMVTWETGSQLAQEMKAFAYLECSAKTTEGVGDVLLTAARASLANKKPRKKCRIL